MDEETGSDGGRPGVIVVAGAAGGTRPGVMGAAVDVVVAMLWSCPVPGEFGS